MLRVIKQSKCLATHNSTTLIAAKKSRKCTNKFQPNPNLNLNLNPNPNPGWIRDMGSRTAPQQEV
jgi:hypothetical protein